MAVVLGPFIEQRPIKSVYTRESPNESKKTHHISVSTLLWRNMKEDLSIIIAQNTEIFKGPRIRIVNGEGVD